MFGRYEIRQEIGRGGMASVYLAYDPTFQRQVAVKVLPPHYLENPLLRARFEREARLIATIEHPAIVPVYDFGEQEGQLYLVMRYMPGGSLAALIHQGRLTLAHSARILNLLAPALDAVHARDIVHRDLKPGNILMDAFGNPALSDFGIAHLSEATVDLTGEAVIGTPAYMSPEQVNAEAALDGRSDIYSLGIILFEMLTGRQPFQAATPMSTAMRHLTEPIPEIHKLRPELPNDIQSVLDRSLAKDRNQRYTHATELAFDLQAILDAHPATQQPDRPGSSKPTPSSQHIQASAAASAAATEIGTEAGSLPGSTPPQIASHPPGIQMDKPTEIGEPGQADLQNRVVSKPGQVERKKTGKPSSTQLWLAILGAVLLAILVFAGIRFLRSTLPLRPSSPGPTPPAGQSLVETVADTPNPTPSPDGSTLPQSPETPVTGQEATVEPVAQPSPVFSDDFSSPSSRWPQLNKQDGGYQYQDSANGGEYVISVNQNNSLFWSTHPEKYADSKISVEARRISGDQGYYGLLCRVQDTDDFYYFIVRPDGYFTIGRYQDASYYPLTPGGWTYHDAIQTGDTSGNAVNLLEVVCEGDQLSFSANGQLLGEATDSAFTSGKAGLAAAALDDSGFQASFDNFTVFSPVP
jgi:serine/threonine protein kinase